MNLFLLLSVILSVVRIQGFLDSTSFGHQELSSNYEVGVGIYDMTGPAVEINFMGYAVPAQRGTGIHQRLRARAFVMSDLNKRFAFVSVDGGMGSDLVKMKVINYLNAALGEEIYSTENLAISGTHTHSGPAGFLQYVLFQMTSLGFVKETFEAWVTGISEAILQAHQNLQPANILINRGKLYDSNINRSPTSYLLNPEEERAQYEDGDTDKTFTLLKFVNGKDSKVMGVLNWFAVHGTSMNNTNTLISGDNRGYASYALEKYVNGDDSIAGMGPFVSAFASTNLGDVSPNTVGPKCIDTGLPCDGTTSTCNGKCENCIAFGPGTNGDMFESTKIIGDKQFQYAKTLMETATEFIQGPIDFRHSFVDMPSLNVSMKNGKISKQLCSPAMGYSFAAGTTDGPGMFNFAQGTTTGNIFWNKVRDFLSEPTKEEMACQHPKPILLNTGDIDVPYAWDPHIVPIQILRLGNLFILAVPAEFTTMAGRRLRKAMEDKIKTSGIVKDNTIYVTIAGLANSYASYVTTYEEYQAQRYEAASTIFGPHTLEAYIQEFSRLMDDIIANRSSDTGPSPPDLTDVQIQLIPDTPFFDAIPSNHTYGEVVPGFDVNSSYIVGDTVLVKFYSANPRNNQKTQGTFLTVEKQRTTGKGYVTVATDGDWETKFHWQGGIKDPLDFAFLPFSVATITWDIPVSAQGTYRICHFGDHKIVKTGVIVPFQGCSSTFEVLSP